MSIMHFLFFSVSLSSLDSSNRCPANQIEAQINIPIPHQRSAPRGASASASTGGRRHGLHPPPSSRRGLRRLLHECVRGSTRGRAAAGREATSPPAPSSSPCRRPHLSTGMSQWSPRSVCALLARPCADGRISPPHESRRSPQPARALLAPALRPASCPGGVVACSLLPAASLRLLLPRSQRAPPGGEDGIRQAEPGGASHLWLRPGEMAPESVFRRAPAPEPGVKHAFGRAPPGAARGAGAGALPNRPEFSKGYKQSLLNFSNLCCSLLK
jgi:hypothetical protein